MELFIFLLILEILLGYTLYRIWTSPTFKNIEMRKSYDQIQADALENEKKDGQPNKAQLESKKKRTQMKLQQKVNTAEMEQMEAEEAFEAAVLSGEGIDGAALKLKEKDDTLKFYKDLVEGLFPTKQQA